MKELKHEYVIELKDYFIDGEKLYLVMEYASKGSLFDLIVQRKKHGQPFSLDDVLTYVI